MLEAQEATYCFLPIAVDRFSPDGTVWNTLVSTATTPFVYLAVDLANWSQDIDLKRMVRG